MIFTILVDFLDFTFDMTYRHINELNIVGHFGVLEDFK